MASPRQMDIGHELTVRLICLSTEIAAHREVKSTLPEFVFLHQFAALSTVTSELLKYKLNFSLIAKDSFLLSGYYK